MSYTVTDIEGKICHAKCVDSGKVISLLLEMELNDELRIWREE